MHQSRHANLSQPANGTAIRELLFVSRGQIRNGLMHHFCNVNWVIEDIDPDFVFASSSSCALFISLKFQSLHPSYLRARVLGLGCSFALRVVVCLVDDEDANISLPGVNRFAGLGDCSLVCAWSHDEAARYIEFFNESERLVEKSNESNNNDYITQLHEALTCLHGIHKIDAATLAARFGTFACILRATHRSLLSSPGLGLTKVVRLFEAFHAPLLIKSHF